MMGGLNVKNTIWSYIKITAGTVLMGIGVYFFEFPNHFSTGGMGGISLVLSEIFPNFSPGSLVMILNIAFLIVGYLMLGKGFAAKTVYCSVLFSGIVWVLEFLVPMTKPLTNNMLLELLCDMILVSLGGAIVFNEDGSSGGTDIPAMIIRKYIGLDVGKSLLIIDFLVVFAMIFVYGVEIGLFSLFAIVLRALVVDNSMDSFNMSKYFMIITDKPDEILEYITFKLIRGATVIPNCQGGYTKNVKTIILVVIDKRQAVHLKKEIKKIDEGSFTIIGNSSEIMGDGFKTTI